MRRKFPAAAKIHNTHMPTIEMERKMSIKVLYTTLLGMIFLMIKQVSNFIFLHLAHSRGLAHSDHSTNADKSPLEYRKLKKYIGDWE